MGKEKPKTLSCRISMDLYRSLNHACTDRDMSAQDAVAEALEAWIEHPITVHPHLGEPIPANGGIVKSSEKTYTLAASESDILQRVENILQRGPVAARAAVIAILELAETPSMEQQNGGPDPVSELVEAANNLEKHLETLHLGSAPEEAPSHPRTEARPRKTRKTGGARTA